jgi:hypothetical protein
VTTGDFDLSPAFLRGRLHCARALTRVCVACMLGLRGWWCGAASFSRGATDDAVDGSMRRPAFQPKREFPSYLKYFMTDDCTFSNSIDLASHASETGAVITNAVVQELSDIVPSMTAVNINKCYEVTDIGLWCVHDAVACDLTLQCMSYEWVTECSALSVSVPMSMSVCEHYRALARTCTTLRELRMQGLTQVTSVGLRSISLQCRDMRVLDMGWAMCVDDLCIRVLAAGLWSLEEVNLSGLRVSRRDTGTPLTCCTRGGRRARRVARRGAWRRSPTPRLWSCRRAATTSTRWPCSRCRSSPTRRCSRSRSTAPT